MFDNPQNYISLPYGIPGITLNQYSNYVGIILTTSLIQLMINCAHALLSLLAMS